MKLLLDTHTFLWWDSHPDQLSETILELCHDPKNSLFLSVVSLWEMQIKSQLNKLELRLPLQQLFQEQYSQNGIMPLNVLPHHIFTVATLAQAHKDPFDRLLIAQAKTEKMILLSKDHVFKDYDVDVIW